MTRLLFALYRARDSLPCISHIVPVANMQYAKARSISSKYLHNTVLHCVVPENIHTPPPTEGIGISRGVGDQRPRKILRGGSVVSIYIIFSRPVPLFLDVKFSVCILLTDPRTQTLILLTAQN